LIKRPEFINSNLNTQKSNFKELNTDGDLYLKKMKLSEISNTQTEQKEVPEEKKRKLKILARFMLKRIRIIMHRVTGFIKMMD